VTIGPGPTREVRPQWCSSNPEAARFAEFLETLSPRIGASDQGLGTVRDICESLHLAGAEPEGVSYAEVDANGVPAMWAVP
jgi:monoterpene epsilon-lactone hydrolase